MLVCVFTAVAIALSEQGGAMDEVVLNSGAFEPNEPIPTKYTCEGEDVSPTLTWSGVPSGTKSLALIFDDPDVPDPAAPKRTWVHWVLYDVPLSTKGLPEAIGANSLPSGIREGLNDWKRTGYGGPCPPIGRHRYFFKLYALDTVLGDLGEPTKAQLEKAMAGHILDEAQLVGTYQKSGN
jgi:Raf kinase inhibitor-like YbhB/YbcL family protein